MKWIGTGFSNTRSIARSTGQLHSAAVTPLISFISSRGTRSNNVITVNDGTLCNAVREFSRERLSAFATWGGAILIELYLIE
jgi:hypothetical protein